MKTQKQNKPDKAELFRKEYDKVIDRTADLFSLGETDREKMRSNVISRIVVTLPYLAKCRNPERTALSHLITTYAASQGSCKETFLHNPTDNDHLFDRLRPIASFDGGDVKVIKSGMNLLALLMLSDYKKDRELDLLKNKYNPLNSGAWDYEALEKKLLDELENLGCPEMAYLPGEEYVRESFWELP